CSARRRPTVLRQALLVVVAPSEELGHRPHGDQSPGGGADRCADPLPALGGLVDLLAQVGDGVRELAPLVRELTAEVGLSGHRATPPLSARPPRPPAPGPASSPSAT